MVWNGQVRNERLIKGICFFLCLSISVSECLSILHLSLSAVLSITSFDMISIVWCS